MNKLSKFLLIGLLENESKVIALYGGGFKPPTKGHFQVVKQTLEQYPEIDKLYVVIGSGLRNNISQDESSSIWEIYKKYLSDKIEIIKSESPLKYIKNYLEENPDSKTYAIVGTREGDENDIKDFTQRKDFFEKYGTNVEVINISTTGGVSGTKAREAAKTSQEEFNKYLPDELTQDEQDLIYDYVQSVIKEDIQQLELPASTENIFLPYVKSLTKYMIDNGLEIQPLPKVKFIDDDVTNANDFFGRTAYYDPNQKIIVLYTLRRHPKDIMRSFAHEMIHHKQNLEGRLCNVSTQNTNEGGDLPELEREAYEKGNMFFRNWEDTIKNPPQTISLNEGRYDKISNVISSTILEKWKEDFQDGKKVGSYQDYIQTNTFDFKIDARIVFSDEEGQLEIDGNILEKDDETTLEVFFKIPKNNIPQEWSSISMGLKDLIRHEIEHLTQSDEENYPSKYMKDDQLIRDLIGARLLSPSQYFKLEKEVDANLQGMYFRAKKEKRPFIDVINDYLNMQDISQQQKEEIIDIWRNRAKALSLPKF
jgi:phosphopantetheine adenylyltransferase